VTLTEWFEGFYKTALTGKEYREHTVECICEEGEVMIVPRGE
jgi:hypothetical protein